MVGLISYLVSRVDIFHSQLCDRLWKLLITSILICSHIMLSIASYDTHSLLKSHSIPVSETRFSNIYKTLQTKKKTEINY